MVTAIQNDPTLKVIMDDLQQDSTSHPSYSVIQQLLFFKGRLVIPIHSKCVPQFLVEFHFTPMGGHFGVFRSYRRVATTFYWKGMMRTVQGLCCFLSCMLEEQI